MFVHEARKIDPDLTLTRSCCPTYDVQRPESCRMLEERGGGRPFARLERWRCSLPTKRDDSKMPTTLAQDMRFRKPPSVARAILRSGVVARTKTCWIS